MIAAPARVLAGISLIGYALMKCQNYETTFKVLAFLIDGFKDEERIINEERADMIEEK